MKLLPFNKFYYKMNDDLKNILAEGKPTNIPLKDFIFNFWIRDLLDNNHNIKDIIMLSPKSYELVIRGQYKKFIERRLRPVRPNWSKIHIAISDTLEEPHPYFNIFYPRRRII